ncbi:hypothetical protein O6H91_11G108000 [Diphasiastrum complanatum]|uniref:Uncharacterized protein n=1 Tax=Diphasiastrum complanatum TaxID=34168 RepID=A0ACC2CCL1_DIPCM|nr:hypothetical protein O6H91_11G108000 [Diphasiastrum complanatum]
MTAGASGQPQPDVSRILAVVESKSDNAMTRWQQAEEKLRDVNEKLISALSDNVLKDNMVKQHSKVAEEAVFGWEKAEAEAAALKPQLESALQQKAAADDQLSHLDEALKECMRELRHVKEEQEQKITGAVMESNRKWEKVRIDFEAKLAGLNHQLIESEAENKALSRNVQERGRTVIELSDGKSQAEAEVSVLHIRLGTIEKENSSLEYELNLLTKELEIRNEEREYNKRELEVSSRQNLENTKQIAKLEAECQKLRTLVRRKLPGPAAIAQMKVEVETLGCEMGESRRRRTYGKYVNPSGTFSLETAPQRLQNGHKEMEMFVERIHGMEEETKMLREILAQRNGELHAARLLCAKTATKLSTVEAHLEAMSQCSAASGIRSIGADSNNLTALRCVGSKGAVSVVSMSEGSTNHDDQVSCADTWASASVSELVHLKKDEVATNMKNMLDPSKLKLMDDFTEMEHLASISETVGSDSAEVKELTDNMASSGGRIAAGYGEQSLMDKSVLDENELQSTKAMCSELRSKLAFTVQQLSCLQVKNSTNEATIISLQEKLDLMLVAQAQNTEMDAVLKQANVAVADICTQITDGCSDISSGNPTNQQLAQATAFHSTQKTLHWATEDVPPTLEVPSDKQVFDDSRPKLSIHKAIRLIEALAQALGIECYDKSIQHLYEGAEHTNQETAKDKSMQHSVKGEDHTAAREISTKSDIAVAGKVWENTGLKRGMEKIVLLSDKLLQCNTSFAEFMQELSFVFEILAGFASSFGGMPRGRETEPHEVCSQALKGKKVVTSSCGSVVNKSDEQQNEIKDIKMVNLTLVGEIGVSDSVVNEKFSGFSTEIENIHHNKLAEAFDMPEAFSRFAQIKEELSQIKCEKHELEQRLEAANATIETLKTQLKNTEQLVAELQEKLMHSQHSKQSTDKALAPLDTSKTVNSHARPGDDQEAHLQEKLSELQLELQKEQRQHKDALARIKEAEEQLNRIMSNSRNPDQVSTKASASEVSQPSPDEHDKHRKEKEIAAATEKLEECQKTILVLGKQLKALASPQDSPNRSLNSKPDSPSSIVKHRQNFDPFCSYSADLGTEREIYNLQAHSAQQSNHGHGWSRVDRDREVECPWSPPRYVEYSPRAPRRQTGVGHKSRAYRRQKDVGYYGSDEFRSPDKTGYVDELMTVPSSPAHESQFTPAKPPAGYPSLRKRGSSINDLSKAFQAVNARSPSGKHGGSALSRFFSRSKSQLK